MNKTKIEWVKNPDGTQGYTWNPITGCLNHVNGMCKGGNFPCYAYRLANTRLKERYLANGLVAYDYAGDGAMGGTEEGLHNAFNDPFYPRFWPERLRAPVKGYTRTDYGGSNAAASSKGIFVCDMSDLFGIGVPEEWTKKVLGVIKSCYYHRFYLLTKQPQNLIKFQFPDNCWVGVTITNNDLYYKSFFRESGGLIDGFEAKVKFISFEPLLESITASKTDGMVQDFSKAGINWVIIGAQTKPTVLPKIEWVQEIVEAADKAGIPVFIKDNLLHEWGITHSPNFRKLPQGVYKVRQELPKKT